MFGLIGLIVFQPQLLAHIYTFLGFQKEASQLHAAESNAESTHEPSAYPGLMQPPTISFPAMIPGESQANSFFNFDNFNNSNTGFVPSGSPPVQMVNYDQPHSSVYPASPATVYPATASAPLFYNSPSEIQSPTGTQSSPMTVMPTLPPGEVPVYRADVPAYATPIPSASPVQPPFSQPPLVANVPDYALPPLGPSPIAQPVMPPQNFPADNAGYPALTFPPTMQSSPVSQIPGGQISNGPFPGGTIPGEPTMVASAQQYQVEPKIAELEFLSGAEVLAKVGTELILLCDVLPEVRKHIEEIIKKEKEEIPPDQYDEYCKEVESFLIPQILEQKIRWTVFYVDAKTNCPNEQFLKIEEFSGQVFNKEQVPRLITQYEVEDRFALDKKLQSYGSSLEREKREFLRMYIGEVWSAESAKIHETSLITQHDMLEYYEQNKEKLFRCEARARWEELAVSFSKVPDVDIAWNMIAEMGNRVMRGEPFSKVAERYSQGLSASQGGIWDWCQPGSLRSEMIDHAIFTIPVGKLSTIFRDETGFHIVRVIEREDVHYVPFEKVHNEIRKGIQKQREMANRKKFEDEVFKKYTIALSPTVNASRFTTAVAKGATYLR